MWFQVLEEVRDIQTIAVGTAIRIYPLLCRRYGKGRWRKMKGVAHVRLLDGRIRLAELHWYEAHGIGKRNLKPKRLLG